MTTTICGGRNIFWPGGSFPAILRHYLLAIACGKLIVEQSYIQGVLQHNPPQERRTTVPAMYNTKHGHILFLRATSHPPCSSLNGRLCWSLGSRCRLSRFDRHRRNSGQCTQSSNQCTVCRLGLVLGIEQQWVVRGSPTIRIIISTNPGHI